jgi:DNA-binding response OmpR family regulator
MSRRAIVIEDDPKLSVIYSRALQHAGFETLPDINGNQYLARLGESAPDLVLLDLHLPYAAGVEVLTDLRGRFPEAVIVVATADVVKARTLPAGADHVLIKPVSVARLIKIADAVKAAV